MKSIKSTKTILTIDDDPSFNLLLKNVIKKSPYEVITTQSVDHFIKVLTQIIPDLCIVDLNFDKKIGAGFKLVELIKKYAHNDLPILVVSKMSSPEDISQALDLGANDFIPKPLDDAVLLYKLDNYLQNSIPVGGHYPLFRMPDSYKLCSFTLPFTIVRVNEFNLTLQSSHHVSVGTTVVLSGPFIQRLTGQREFLVLVANSSKVANSDQYEIEVALPEENREIRIHIRRWINTMKLK